MPQTEPKRLFRRRGEPVKLLALLTAALRSGRLCYSEPDKQPYNLRLARLNRLGLLVPNANSARRRGGLLLSWGDSGAWIDRDRD